MMKGRVRAIWMCNDSYERCSMDTQSTLRDTCTPDLRQVERGESLPGLAGGQGEFPGAGAMSKEQRKCREAVP